MGFMSSRADIMGHIISDRADGVHVNGLTTIGSVRSCAGTVGYVCGCSSPRLSPPSQPPPCNPLASTTTITSSTSSSSSSFLSIYRHRTSPSPPYHPLCVPPLVTHPPMAERAPPSTPPRPAADAPFDPDTAAYPLADPNSHPESSFHLGTYVVQVPKDQVYRVPPPENAYLAERYRNKDKTRRKSPCVGLLKWILSAALLIFFLLVVIVVVFFVTAKPATPTFAVERLAVKSSGTSHLKPEYDLTMRVHNPSQKMGYAYEAGGTAVIAHSSVDIAAGKTPGLRQGYQNTTTFRLVLHGSNTDALPKTIDRSLHGSKDVVSLELTARFVVTPRTMGVDLWTTSLDLACAVGASGLGKEARIVSQECKSNLKL
ncbi:hypothetical protein BHE74_00040408 [Ensete ventricosum]|nr:hypothetical protein BHE74_00040408 [Ensete ventricosum]